MAPFFSFSERAQLLYWGHDVVPPIGLKISHFGPRKYPGNTSSTSLGSWQNYIYTEWKDEIWLQFHVVAINIYSTSNDSSPHVPMIIALELHDITWFATTSIHSMLPPLFGTSPCSPSLIFSKHFQPFPSSHAVGMAAFFKAPGPVNGGTTSWLDEGKKWRSYHPYVEKRLEVGICVFVCFILY